MYNKSRSCPDCVRHYLLIVRDFYRVFYQQAKGIESHGNTNLAHKAALIAFSKTSFTPKNVRTLLKLYLISIIICKWRVCRLGSYPQIWVKPEIANPIYNNYYLYVRLQYLQLLDMICLCLVIGKANRSYDMIYL